MADKRKFPLDKNRPVSHEEKDLWRKVTDDIQPLPGLNVFMNGPAVETSNISIQEKRPSVPNETSPLQPVVSISGITDRRVVRQLKKGKMPIEARIDLHGMNQDQAFVALTNFIEGARNHGKRCVLVITGKGLRGPSSGVLRSEVPKWLNQSPNREGINGFTQAGPRDGGTGALYVLLKKKR